MAHGKRAEQHGHHHELTKKIDGTINGYCHATPWKLRQVHKFERRFAKATIRKELLDFFHHVDNGGDDGQEEETEGHEEVT